MLQLLRVQPVLLLVVVSSGIPLAAQGGPTAGTVTQEVREYRVAHEAEILNELRDLLALPNVASDSENIERNANHIVAMLEARGATARVLRVEGSPPAVLGQIDAGAARTVVFYAHYDGQPVDTTRWSSSPWQPIMRDGILEEGASEKPWGAASSGVAVTKTAMNSISAPRSAR